jgi:hypothetical protein
MREQMLILVSMALFIFGLLLFSFGIAVWLLGLVIRITIRLFQLGLLLVWACIAFTGWLRRRQQSDVLEGEILPPEQRALPDRSHVKRLLVVGALMLIATVAHADDWRQRAKEATAATSGHQPCVLHADLRDNRLHLRVPICFYNNGDIYAKGYEGELAFNGIKAGATHPAIKCDETIEGVERVDPATFLVRLYCEHATPQARAVTVQLIDGTIHIFNVEAY